MARRSRGRTLALIAVLLTGATISAHEIGTTRVSVTFPLDGTYRAEIVTDASSLLDKLEAAAREPRSGAAEVGELRDRLRRHAGLIPRKVTVAFDNVPTDPAMSIDVAPSADVGGVPGATIVLTGPRPDQPAS